MTNQSIPQSTVKFQGKNEYFISGDTAEIVLYDKDGDEKCRTVIDSEDVERCAQYRWSLSGRYTVHSKYMGPSAPSMSVPLHGFLLNFKGSHKVQMDHINRDPLFNRKSNLRICTKQQNMQNNSQGLSATGFRGVYPAQSMKGRWRSVIKHNGLLQQVGTFDSPTEAAIAWNAKALELRGEFAVLNEV